MVFTIERTGLRIHSSLLLFQSMRESQCLLDLRGKKACYSMRSRRGNNWIIRKWWLYFGNYYNESNRIY